MKKVFVCSEDEELKKLVFSIDGIVSSESEPDVLILDQDNPKEKIIHPCIFISDGSNADVDCEYILVRPCSAQMIKFAIEIVAGNDDADEMQCKKINDLLLLMGMDEKRKGTKYASEAVRLYLEHKKKLQFSELFDLIAVKYNTSSQAVERALRTAIENMCQKGNINGIYEVFGNSIDPEKGKPSNAEFISALAQRCYFISSKES